MFSLSSIAVGIAEIADFNPAIQLLTSPFLGVSFCNSLCIVSIASPIVYRSSFGISEELNILLISPTKLTNSSDFVPTF